MPRPRPGMRIDSRGGGLEWAANTPCVGLSHLFFSDDSSDIRRAKLMCVGCVRRAVCLETALAFKDDNGVWGGMTGPERRRLARRRLVA